MTTKKINFRDPVVERVVDRFILRSDEGYKKYGQTLDERSQGVKGLQDYINDVQEELMDAVLYLQSVQEEIQDLKEELLVLRAEQM